GLRRLSGFELRRHMDRQCRRGLFAHLLPDQLFDQFVDHEARWARIIGRSADERQLSRGSVRTVHSLDSFCVFQYYVFCRKAIVAPVVKFMESLQEPGFGFLDCAECKADLHPCQLASWTSTRTRKWILLSDSEPLSEILFPACVELFDMLLEVLQHTGAAHFHGSGQFAVLDSQLPLENAILADLLEWRELLVHPLDSLPKLLRHRFGGGHFRRRLTLEHIHPI